MIKIKGKLDVPKTVGKVLINSECKEYTCDCGYFNTNVEIVLDYDNVGDKVLYLKGKNNKILVDRQLLRDMDTLIYNGGMCDLFKTGDSEVSNESLGQLLILIFKLSKEHAVIIK